MLGVNITPNLMVQISEMRCMCGTRIATLPMTYTPLEVWLALQLYTEHLCSLEVSENA
jgi:hypothetical protein